MKLPTDDEGNPIMGYFGPGPAPGGLEIVEHPRENCFVCRAAIADDEHGLVIPYSGKPDDPDHVAAHLKCWRTLIRGEV